MVLFVVIVGYGNRHRLVSTAAGADHGRIRWRRLRIYRIEDRVFACCRRGVVDIACGFVCTAGLRLRATTL